MSHTPTTQDEHPSATAGPRVALFAQTNYRNQRSPFGIKRDDRRRHMYVVGKTGMGKTTMLEHLIASDIRTGEGVAVIDPHGELAERVLDFVPSTRIRDVVYFNPADREQPFAFNALDRVPPDQRHLLADGLVEVFRRLWADSWGPRLEYLLRNALLALLEYPNATLLGVMRLLVDTRYRDRVVARVSDPVVRSFWANEFARYPDRFLAEAVAPIQNKVGQFLTSPLIRNIVGQTRTAVSLREAMDSGLILVANLSKGRIGESSARLLGAMLVTKLHLAAMSRVDLPQRRRRDFYLYVDEFQNFATDSFGDVLSEARKYRLNLILAHQYLEQLTDPLRAAVFGNVGTIVSFRIGAADAEYLEREFSPEFTAHDLVNLSKFDIYVRLLIDGVASRPFSATTFPPERVATSHRATIIKVSRERYGTARLAVEDRIRRWSRSN